MQRWADSSGSPGSAWLGRNAVLALGVALALTVITLVVEYVLLVMRDRRAARSPRPQ